MFKKNQIKAQNSRRFKRLRADYLIKFQVPGTSGEPSLSNMKDLSAGGVKFWTDQYVAEGTLVKVSFLVPPLDMKVDTLARVVRVRTGGGLDPIYYVATRFIEISQDAKAAIDEFVEHLSMLPQARKMISNSPVVKRAAIA